MQWSDYDGQNLHVRRSVWRTVVNQTKTESSEASVPVLQKILTEHRTRVNGHGEQYIFAGERRGTPLNLANLARRVIIPACEEYSVEIQHPVEFRGWHAFRRSLATMLLSCGVEPRLIMEILRHANISTTMNIYAQVSNDDARRALRKIEDLLLRPEGSLHVRAEVAQR